MRDTVGLPPPPPPPPCRLGSRSPALLLLLLLLLLRRRRRRRHHRLALTLRCRRLALDSCCKQSEEHFVPGTVL